jgi:starch synthase
MIARDVRDSGRRLEGLRITASRAQANLTVAVASSGRFHLLDLARELDGLGADVKFYSYVSRRRAKAFGLPERCHVALLPLLFPLVALERLFPQILPRAVERMMCWALDVLVTLRLQRCDIFIGMSGIYLRAARFAQRRYGALVHLHRSSRHILSQRDILARLPGARQVSPFMMRRELEGYALADHIIVPSSHVVESFSPWPTLAAKLFLNPLGVDTDLFPLQNGRLREQTPTVLFVGQWSLRKGVDVLAEAISAMPGVRLVHVGALSDAPFPTDPRFVHHDHVPQHQLPGFYSTAHVFVLPSREDGFGVVLSQALSSGLQVVCTDRTGGPDLAALPGFCRLVRTIPAENAMALRVALEHALVDATGKTGVEPITRTERELLGWRCYAERDLRFMRGVLARRRRPGAGLSSRTGNEPAAQMYEAPPPQTFK